MRSSWKKPRSIQRVEPFAAAGEGTGPRGARFHLPTSQGQSVNNPSIAYFSMEICLEQAIPTYSGGLGVLAGDTLRSVSEVLGKKVQLTDVECACGDPECQALVRGEFAPGHDAKRKAMLWARARQGAPAARRRVLRVLPSPAWRASRSRQLRRP